MYGVLGEHRSDAETVTVLVRRLAGNQKLPVLHKGYSGGGELRRKGAKQLRFFASRGCDGFIICHDADGPDPDRNESLVRRDVVEPSGLAQACCLVIPVQAIEAWILAHLECATEIFKGWQPESETSPEAVNDPKAHLVRLSRKANGRPRYDPVTHNPRMAEHLDLRFVEQRCASFRPLAAFVRDGGAVRN